MMETITAQYQLNFEKPVEVQQAYMDFIQGGGIFIPTKQKHQLGEEISVQITLPGQTAADNCVGKVVWINPAFNEGGRPEGIGMQLQGNNAEAIQNQIKYVLKGFHEDVRSDTM